MLIKKIFLLLAGFLVAITLSEVILHKWVSSRLFYRIDVSSSHGTYRLSSNRALIYIPSPNTGEFNSYGHRGGTVPFTKGKRKRIVFLGDSVVEGLGVGVPERFTDLLGKMIGDRHEIVNLGVCGYSFLQEVEYLKTFGLKFSPDYVFFGFTYNDLELNSGEIDRFSEKMYSEAGSGFYQKYYSAQTGIAGLLKCSNIYMLIHYLCAADVEGNFLDSIHYTLRTAQAEDILAQVRTMAHTYHFKVVFIFLPWNTLLLHDEMEKFKETIKRHGYQIIDLNDSPVFTGEGKNGIFSDCCHLTVEGNRIVAEQLYKKLKGAYLE